MSDADHAARQQADRVRQAMKPTNMPEPRDLAGEIRREVSAILALLERDRTYPYLETVKVRRRERGAWFLYKTYSADATDYGNSNVADIYLLADGTIARSQVTKQRDLFPTVKVIRTPVVEACLEGLRHLRKRLDPNYAKPPEKPDTDWANHYRGLLTGRLQQKVQQVAAESRLSISGARAIIRAYPSIVEEAAELLVMGGTSTDAITILRATDRYTEAQINQLMYPQR